MNATCVFIDGQKDFFICCLESIGIIAWDKQLDIEYSDPFTHFIHYRPSFTANHFGDETGRVPKLILKQRFVYTFVGLKHMSRN